MRWLRLIWSKLSALWKPKPDTRPPYTPELADKLLHEVATMLVQQRVEILDIDQYQEQGYRTIMMQYVLDRCRWEHLSNGEIIKLNKKVKEKWSLIRRKNYTGSGGRKVHPDFLPENMWRNYQ